jgi:hypothetical protein
VATSTSQSAPVSAIAASQFLDSLGVNVHTTYSNTVYADTSLVESDLAYLGTNNVRDGINAIGAYNSVGEEALAAAGYKFDFVMETPTASNMAALDWYAENYPGSVVSVEGPNEVGYAPITFDGGAAASNEVELQQAIYNAVHSDPNLDGINVVNLTLGLQSSISYSQLGNMTSVADEGNAHVYAPYGFSPAYDWSGILSEEGAPTAGLPMVVTEAGYTTDPSYISGVDDTVQAKYDLDLLMDAAKSGVAQIYLYELLDEEPNSTNDQDDYGLFNNNGTPKPAATAIHNLTTILNDPTGATSFQTGTLNYTVTGLPSDGSQVLFEKESGTYDLALWAEPNIWNSTTQQEVAAPSEVVTVNFAQAEQEVLVFDPLLGATPIASYSNVSQLQVTITDHPLIIEVENAGAPAGTFQAAPTIVSYSPGASPVGSGLSNLSQITLAGDAPADSTVTVFDGTTALGSATALGNGTWSVTTGALADGVHNFTAIDSSAGGVSTASSDMAVTIETAAPAPTIVSFSPDIEVQGDGTTGANVVILNGTAAPDSSVQIYDGTWFQGTAYANASGSWSFTTPKMYAGVQSFTATATDTFGNVSSTTSAFLVNIDAFTAASPTVASDVASGTGTINGMGDLGAGRVVTLTVNLSEAVTVAGGTPTLSLNDGGIATYTGGSGTSGLTFSYTVASGQNTADLAVTMVNLGTATIKDKAGNVANLTGAVTNLTGTLQIDTTAPTVTQVAVVPVNGTEDPGATIALTIDLTEAVTVTGTPTLTLNDGGVATYTGGSGTNSLTFSYKVGATDSTVATLAITQVNLPGGATVKDGAGNAADLAGAVVTFPGLAIDPPPIVMSITDSLTSVELNAGKTVTLTLAFNEAVTVAGGAPTLTLNDGGTATYAGGSGTAALTFSYTVTAGQNTTDLTVVSLNLGVTTIKDGTGNAANLSLTGLTQTGPQVDTATSTAMLDNFGRIWATGATLTLNTGLIAITNESSGVLGAQSGGILEIDSNVDQASGASEIRANAGSKVFINDITVTGGQVDARAATAEVFLNNTTLANASLDSGGTAGVITTEGLGSVLDGGINTADLVVADGTALTLQGTINNQQYWSNSQIDVGSTGDQTELLIDGSVTLDSSSGVGVVALSNNGANIVDGAATGATLDNVNNTIMGAGTIGSGDGLLTLSNAGTINADDTTALTIDTGNAVTNSGTLEATAGGGLVVDGAVTNEGIIAADGANVTIGGDLTGNGASQAAEIFSGNQMELKGSSNNAAMSFQNNAGDTGVLVLDHSVGFAGTIAGLAFDGTNSDTLDLRDINFASGVTWSFVENNNGQQGILTVKDGSGDTANIALIGQYLAAGSSATSATSTLFNVAADDVMHSSGTLVTTTFQPHAGG